MTLGIQVTKMAYFSSQRNVRALAKRRDKHRAYRYLCICHRTVCSCRVVRHRRVYSCINSVASRERASERAKERYRRLFGRSGYTACASPSDCDAAETRSMSSGAMYLVNKYRKRVQKQLQNIWSIPDISSFCRHTVALIS